jgi:hypothetical protein
MGPRAVARGKTEIELDWRAPGTDADNPPAADGYLVKESTRPIRDQHDFTTAQALCKGACRFAVTRVGAKIGLTITDLSPRTTYYYSVAARDNITSRSGARSVTIEARTA